jgi:multicomponent Na+:H+ antiporter subunit E
MRNYLSRLKLFLILLALWFLLNFNLEIPTIIFGIVISFFVSLLGYNTLYTKTGLRYKGLRITSIIHYVLLLFVEIFKSSFLFVINLLSGGYKPKVFKIELDLYDPVQVAIVANSITLTPGTISIDVVGHTIYVMVLAKPEATQEELEAPIRSKFEKLLKAMGEKK